MTLHRASFHAEYMQASRFTNLYIYESGFIAEHSTDITFRDPYIYDSDVVLKESGQVRIDGGYIGYARIDIQGTEDLVSGGWGGPVVVTGVHAEHSEIGIRAHSAFVLLNFFLNVSLGVRANEWAARDNDWLDSRINGEYAGCM